MQDLNVGEYGQVLRINFNADLTTATSYGFTLQPKFGVAIEKDNTTGVTIGTSNTQVGENTYLANEFIEYTIEPEQLKEAGQYRMKADAVFPNGIKLITDFQQFTVLE